ncbi:MAG: hypothetical protein H5T69_04595 [Chloroflexi bacterium]|nr:hypothetical protein [Chloroflexota bacterium]
MISMLSWGYWAGSLSCILGAPAARLALLIESAPRLAQTSKPSPEV